MSLQTEQVAAWHAELQRDFPWLSMPIMVGGNLSELAWGAEYTRRGPTPTLDELVEVLSTFTDKGHSPEGAYAAVRVCIQIADAHGVRTMLHRYRNNKAQLISFDAVVASVRAAYDALAPLEDNDVNRAAKAAVATLRDHYAAIGNSKQLSDARAWVEDKSMERVMNGAMDEMIKALLGSKVARSKVAEVVASVLGWCAHTFEPDAEKAEREPHNKATAALRELVKKNKVNEEVIESALIAKYPADRKLVKAMRDDRDEKTQAAFNAYIKNLDERERDEVNAKHTLIEKSRLDFHKTFSDEIYRLQKVIDSHDNSTELIRFLVPTASAIEIRISKKHGTKSKSHRAPRQRQK